jgi:putative hemolysin
MKTADKGRTMTCEVSLKVRAFERLFILILACLVASPAAAMRNPDAVYCQSLGYKYYTAHTKRGAMGVCVLPNDRMVNASDFYGGKVALEWSYCAAQGYGAKRDESGVICHDCLVCVLPGGEEKEVGELMGLVFRESVLPAYTLTVAKAGTGSGKITSNLPGIDCGSVCFSAYDSGTPVTLTAQPDSGSTFAGWSGGGCSGTGDCVVTVGDNVTVTATFARSEAPPFGISPASKDFGIVNIDSTTSQVFTLSNNGAVDLSIASIQLTGNDAAMFSLALKGPNHCSSLTPTIAPGGSCAFRVKFTPSTEGAKTTTLRVTSGSPAGLVDVRLDGTGALPPVFADCPEAQWAEDFVNTLYYHGVTGGCNAENYCPDNPVTRAQMAVFIITAMGETPSTAAYDANFDDIPNDGYAPFINRMSELGIAAGCRPRAYCPNDLLTRQQMAVFIIAAMGETGSTAAFNANFNDIVNDGFAPFINRMNELGITGGCGPKAYCPNDSTNRAMMAVFVVTGFF